MFLPRATLGRLRLWLLFDTPLRQKMTIQVYHQATGTRVVLLKSSTSVEHLRLREIAMKHGAEIGCGLTTNLGIVTRFPRSLELSSSFLLLYGFQRMYIHCPSQEDAPQEKEDDNGGRDRASCLS